MKSSLIWGKTWTVTVSGFLSGVPIFWEEGKQPYITPMSEKFQSMGDGGPLKRPTTALLQISAMQMFQIIFSNFQVFSTKVI